MKEKRKNKIFGTFIKVIPLLFIVYASISGKHINVEEYDYVQTLLNGFIDFITFTFISMVIPFFVRLFNETKFSNEKGKKICWWNGFGTIIFWAIIDVNSFGGIYDEVFVNMGTNIVYAIIFYFVNKWIFVDENKNDLKIKGKRKNQNKKNNKWEINLCPNCYAKVKETDEICPKCGNVFKDITQVYENNEVIVSENIVNASIKIQGKTRYCKLCGGKLTVDKKCTKCGKQYFHIKSKSTLILIPISILLIVSIILNIKFYNENEILSDDNWDLYMENKRLEEENEEIHSNLEEMHSNLFNVIGTNSVDYTKRKLDFYDEHIVFVLEGYGKKYYTYDCVMEIVDGEFSFWAYTDVAAKSNGYKKGTC